MIQVLNKYFLFFDLKFLLLLNKFFLILLFSFLKNLDFYMLQDDLILLLYLKIGLAYLLLMLLFLLFHLVDLFHFYLLQILSVEKFLIGNQNLNPLFIFLFFLFL